MNMKKTKTILVIIAILNASLIFAQFPQKQINNAIFGITGNKVKPKNSIKFNNDKTDKYLSLGKSCKFIHQIGPAADTLLITSDTAIYETIETIGAGVLIVNNAILQLYGHLDQYDSSKVFIQNGATLHFPQIHNGQYIHRLQDNSYFKASNSTINTNNVQQIWQYDHSEYISKQTSFTNWNFRKIWDNSILYLEDADMVGDLTINDSCNLTFVRCETILPWMGVDAGDTLCYVFPPWDTVPNYTFSNNLNGVIGIDYSVSFDSCTNVLWGVESWQDSYIHIYSSVISIAFRLFEDDTIKHIYDYTDHVSFEFPFPDRFCKITMSHLYMWFPYVYNDAIMYIDSCRYAESKSYDSSQVYITNSIADGFPSSATAVDDGFMQFSDGLCRTFTTSWFDGTLLLVNTKVEPRPELNAEQNIAYGNSFFLAVNSIFKPTMKPWAMDNALVMFASIDSLGAYNVGENIDIIGSAWIDAGPLNSTKINTIQINDFVKIYPNPTTGIFTIEGKNIRSIEITSISGQVVYFKNPQGFKNLAGLVQVDLKG